jgi:hypothetical protein
MAGHEAHVAVTAGVEEPVGASGQSVRQITSRAVGSIGTCVDAAPAVDALALTEAVIGVAGRHRLLRLWLRRHFVAARTRVWLRGLTVG